MQKSNSSHVRNGALIKKGLPFKPLLGIIVLVISLLFQGYQSMAQSTNRCSASTLAAVNAATCTPGITFNISGSGGTVESRPCATNSNSTNNWGKFIANSSTARISYLPASNRDAVVYAYSGSCTSLNYLGCSDAGGNGTQENISLSGLTAGDTIFVRVMRKNNTNSMNGSICVASPFTIQTGSITGSPFCAGASISVPFTSFGTFSGNTYTAQLSNASGSFASPVSIGTLVSNARTGSISATIPAGTSAGTGYRIRVISSGPAVTGTDNGADLTVRPQPQGVFSGSTVCSVETPELTFTASTGTEPFTVVYNDGVSNRTATNVYSDVAFLPFITPITTTNYNLVSVTDANGCVRTSGFTNGTATITISTIPTILTSAATADRCSSTSPQSTTLSYTLTTGSPNQYSITWDAAALLAGLVNVGFTALPASPMSVPIAGGVAAGTYNGTITVRNAAGCTSTGYAFTVTIRPTPGITASATAANRCFSSSAQTSTLTYSATTNSPTHYTITWNAAALAAGLVNVSSTPLPASPITFPIAAGVVSGVYTGALRVSNSTTGCVSSSSNFTLTIGGLPTITTQPTDQTVCSGNSISFTAAATGTALVYQWRKGTTNLCNCSNISGATSNTLTINPASLSDAASDYNLVVTSGSCPSVISDYVRLTVNTNTVAPAEFPKDLTFPSVAPTTVVGSFTAAGDATHYLVIRKTTNVAPTNPSNGTTYVQGTSALTGVIEYAGTNPYFTANGLTPGTTYYYWIFAYNIGSCGTSPMYNTSTSLSGEVTTATNVACGTITSLYWAGAGSGIPGATSGTDFNTASNWSTSSSTYVASPVAPTQCTNAEMALTSAATITLSSSIEVYGLNFTIAGNSRTAILSANNQTLTVNGDAVIDVVSGNINTQIFIGEWSAGAGVVDFKANFRIGVNYFSGSIPRSHMVGNVNSKIIFRGDVLFGRTARVILPGGSGYPPAYPLAAPGTGTTPGTIEFDGLGLQQVLWNNNVWYDCFYNIVVGNQNKPYVKHVTGTYTPDNILNNLTISDGCTVDLGASQWIREQQGGTFTLGANAKLILGNNLSVRSAANTGVRVTGSNFPGGFSTLNIDPSSTIEYNGPNTITQTVYGVPPVGSLTYGNLILSNGSGSGNAAKNTTSTVTIAGTTNVTSTTTLSMGSDIVTNGNFNVNNGGRINCGNYVMSGFGTFNLESGGSIAIGSGAGIAASGATGNIRTDSRQFSTGANYIYNGASAQASGTGLPQTMNDLTVANGSGLILFAANANYKVNGTLYLTSGTLNINGDTLTVNNLQRNSGTLTGSASSSVGITGTNVPLFFTSGARTLRHLFLGNSASADLQTTLDITAGSNAGSVTVGSGATLNTYGNLTLKSNASGTARVGIIPEDGSGNALGSITGDLTIERYIPAKRSWRLLSMPVSAAGAPTINDALQEGVVNPDGDYANNQNPNPGFGMHISGSSPALGFDPSPLNNASMLTFNRATGAWTGIANTLTMTVRDHEGYMVFVRGDRSTNMTLNTAAPLSNTVLRVRGGLRTGRQTINLAGGTGTYSVVGNPFASTIDFRNVTTTGGVSNKTFVLWDPALTGLRGVGAFQYFTQSGSDYEVFPGGGSYGSAGTINNLIQAGQAFLVQNGSAGTIVIGESAKNTSSSSTVFRPIPSGITGRISTLLYAVESDTVHTLLDGALVLYNSRYADSMDLEDARKLLNNTENFGIQKTGALLQIEKRETINETDTLQYNIRNMKMRNYYLNVELRHTETTGTEAFLKDNFTGTLTRLELNNITRYNFSVTADAASKSQNRFHIQFRNMSVVPVTITDVQAFKTEDAIRVEWNVQNESNIRRYEVEKSADGRSFSKLGEIGSPRNQGSNSYHITDPAPAAGMNFYRIKSIEQTGRSQYSSIVKVLVQDNNKGISVYPNPVTGNIIHLYFSNQAAGNYTARLLNSTGQAIFTGKISQADGNGNTQINLGSQQIPKGNYLLEMIKPDQTRTTIQLIF